MMVIGVFLILDGKLSVGAWSRPRCWLAACWRRYRASRLSSHARRRRSLRSSDRRVMSLERERPPERSYVARRIAKGSIAFENVTFRYPNAPENALEKVIFKIAPASELASSVASDPARRPSAVCSRRSMNRRKAAYWSTALSPPVRSGRFASRHWICLPGYRSILRQVARQHRAWQAGSDRCRSNGGRAACRR